MLLGGGVRVGALWVLLRRGGARVLRLLRVHGGLLLRVLGVGVLVVDGGLARDVGGLGVLLHGDWGVLVRWVGEVGGGLESLC